ncbi:hypothetical protein [Archangium sp.]|jgi:hypothetical protein|uniref:hypothetical protein n=1 Tax=Archangium sp. TaxID=1872627 RepID=UPI002ED97CC6
MYQRNDIKEGMTVRSVDGHKLGKVYAVGETEFHIEKGLFFPKDYAVRFSEISELRHGEIILAHGQDSLRVSSDEVPYGFGTVATREGIGPSPVTRAVASAEFMAGERTGRPFGGRAEDLRTQDLGHQGIGPYNTEGARASPILTQEDRGRPTMSASDDTTVVTPMGSEELVDSRRTMTDEELDNERRGMTETRSDEDLGSPRRIGIDPEEFSKRGF